MNTGLVTISESVVRPIIAPGAKILLVGEAPGKDENALGIPFIGESGQELNRMLMDAGILMSEVSKTNVFNRQPYGNNIEHYYCDRLTYIEKSKVFGTYPPVSAGKYVDPEHARNALDRLHSEIEQAKPTVIVALGNIASWALLGVSGIRKIRGTVSLYRNAIKVIPTYHPAAVLRDWSLRTIVVLDFIKAKREAEFVELRRPRRLITIEPSIEDVRVYFNTKLASAAKVSCDIETGSGQITCIGFAPNPAEAIVIPFFGHQPGGHYWSEHDELTVWRIIREFMRSPVPKEFQNGLYDVQYLALYGAFPFNFLHDTMLQHHSMFAEMPKGLDFLGSIYTDEVAWKTMKPRARDKFKADE